MQFSIDAFEHVFGYAHCDVSALARTRLNVQAKDAGLVLKQAAHRVDAEAPCFRDLLRRVVSAKLVYRALVHRIPIPAIADLTNPITWVEYAMT